MAGCYSLNSIIVGAAALNDRELLRAASGTISLVHSPSSSDLGRFEKGQGLFGDVLLEIGIAVKPDALVFRTVFHAAVTLFGDAVHQLGYDFQIVDFAYDADLFHDSPQFRIILSYL